MNNITEPRLLFRADGNACIGLGHLVRMLALADSLRGLATGLFIVREPTAAVTQLLADEGWAIVTLPADRSWEDEATWLAQYFLRPTDVLLLDGYNFSLEYQRQLQTSGCRLVFVDDLKAWPVVADVLINHSPGVFTADYQKLATTIFLLGPAFSLLRKPFLAAVAKPSSPTHPTSVLLCFGGADPFQLTIRTLEALLALATLSRIGVLVGSAFEGTDTLQELIKQHPEQGIMVYQNVAAIPLVGLFQAHDVVVVPASTVLIEALVLGRPAITGYYADNQRALAYYVHAHQQAFSVGNFADLAPASLAAILRQGLTFLETTQRQPYANQLRPELLRAAIGQLLQN